MKKTLVILEGVATSGKTTTTGKLERLLDVSHKVKIFTEGETLMGIVNNRQFEVAKKHMNDLLERFRNTSADIVIVDRYHLTHTFRTEKNMDSIFELERSLSRDFDVHIFLLTMREDKISGRVQDSWNRRGQWLGKEGTIEEKTAYYIDQQKKLRELAKQSAIPVLEIDTTDMDWDRVVAAIMNNLGLK